MSLAVGTGGWSGAGDPARTMGTGRPPRPTGAALGAVGGRRTRATRSMVQDPERPPLQLLGDPAAEFDAVFADQKQRLWSIAYGVLRDRDEAHDAVQETMVKAWRSWHQLREPDKRAAWLTTICLRHCFRRRGSLGRTQPVPIDDDASVVPFGPPGAAPSVGRRPRDLDLDRAYAKLPPKQRAAVLLHYHLGYTIEQCGELMGCRSGTVRTHVQRALASLRQELGDD